LLSEPKDNSRYRIKSYTTLKREAWLPRMMYILIGRL
jgi:hypothetical protein